MSYQAPNWVNGKPPAINATRLNNLCSTVQTLDETMPTKQNKLTFDNVPTSGSSNPVKSGGIKTALDGKAAAIHTHAASAITSGILPVERGGTGNSTGYVTAGQLSDTVLGDYATAEGYQNTASGDYSHAEGYSTQATGWGYGSHAEGINTYAHGYFTHAEGVNTYAESEEPGVSSIHDLGGAHAEGFGTSASGEQSHAEGKNTNAANIAAHAEGKGSSAGGEAAHAEGMNTDAVGQGSHAEGYTCQAIGNFSHAEGLHAVANGVRSHAEGYETIASGDDQHVFGRYNKSDTTNVEIVGWGTGTADSNRKNIRTLDTSGNMTIAGTLTQSSDAQLKTVEGEIPDVSEVHAVRFRWNDVNGQHDDLEHVGYIAQDVEKVAPFMVKEDSNGYKALDYIAFLCAKMELLERRVKELEEKKE